MKTPAEWIEEQSKNPPRTGSMEHQAQCEAVAAIQLDAFKEGMSKAAQVALEYNTGLITEYSRNLVAKTIRMVRDNTIKL